MKGKFFLKLIAAVWLVTGGPCATLSARDINVIPTPQRMDVKSGNFTFTAATEIAWKGKDAEETARYFSDKVGRVTGFSFEKGRVGRAGTVSFILDKSVQGAEAYRLEVLPDRIEARASTSDGLYYAAQTLLQLLPPEVEAGQRVSRSVVWDVPCVSIEDYPRFVYRGVMLDPCRHFLPVNAVKKQIEMLSAYKINRVHWHLTDDQGWRIEIKKYPQLTQVGGCRVEGDGSVYGGYYTQEEIKDVVAFAKRHHVEIVPEFEMPGHGMAAIAAFPWLSCRGDSMTPRIIWGVEDVVFCPGKETTYRFLEDVIDEMVPLFPGALFHIGGDESPRVEWEHCDSCQQRMSALGYTKEAQLQSYLIGRIGEYLKQKGKQIIGWDEILEGGNLDTAAVIMSWRGEDGGIRAAQAGHPVLMTPSSHGFYFDRYQSDPVTEPTSIGGTALLQQVYAYDPVPHALRGTGKEHLVMGVQANCWSEYMHTPAIMEYRLYPRALALAEVGWTNPGRKDVNDFIRRVDTDAALRLKAHQINFHIPQPEIANGSLNHLAFVDSLTLTFTDTPRPLPIVYTLDGTDPSPRSARYESPLTFTQTTQVKAATVLPCGLMGPVRVIDIQRQQYAPALADTAGMAKGLEMQIFRGTYLTPYQLPAQPDETKVVEAVEALRSQTKVPSSVRNVANYAATVEGCMNIPADGVYEFSSNNNQVWVDGKLLIDNSSAPVPRFSRNNAQIALKGGLHRIKVLFLGGIFAGWPTYWDNAAVNYRPVGQKWQRITPDMLCHKQSAK